MEQKKKIGNLLGEVGDFVVQQESVKLSLIPTKLLKSKENEQDGSFDEDENEKDGSSNEDEVEKDGSSNEDEDNKDGISDNEDKQESSGDKSTREESSEHTDFIVRQTQIWNTKIKE